MILRRNCSSRKATHIMCWEKRTFSNWLFSQLEKAHRFTIYRDVGSQRSWHVTAVHKKMRALCRGTKQSEKTMEERSGEKGLRTVRSLYARGYWHTRVSYFVSLWHSAKSFVTFLARRLRELLLHCVARRSVNAPLKPKSHDKSFPVLPRLGNV